MTIQEEIQIGESRTLEYKTTLPHDSQKWIKTIVSFANRAGGKFVFNVKVEDEDIKYLCRDFSERAERKITKKNLENLNLIIGNKKDTATNAYAILFGKHDYTSRIQCARFRGTERVDFLDKDDRVEISSPGSIYGSLTLEEALSGRSSIRNKTLARTLEKIDVLEGWGSGFKRIFAECDEYGVDRPEFLEIGDMLRVNFYRPSYKKNGDKAQKTAINSKIGDKSAINQSVGDKSAINYKDKILEYLSKHSKARSQDIALFIGLKQSRTKDYLSELVEDGKIVANGANRNRTYSLK